MALDGSSSYIAPNNLKESSDSLPMFDVQRVQLQFQVAADFVAAQVANNVLVLALSTGRILRIDLDSPEDIDGELFSNPSSPQTRLTSCHTGNRHRSPQEVLRSRPDPAHVS